MYVSRKYSWDQHIFQTMILTAPYNQPCLYYLFEMNKAFVETELCNRGEAKWMIFFYQYTILINLTPCLCNQIESEFQWNSLFLSKNVFYRWELWIWDTLRKLFCIFFVLDYYFSFSYFWGYGKLTVSCCLCTSHYDKTYMFRNDTRWWCNFNAKDPLYIIALQT